MYGYGNPGRQDDALGILLVDQMEKWVKENHLESIDFDSNYQLNIEDALEISEYDVVIFADASIEEISDVEISRVIPCQKTEFTMHAMAPEFVLHLCQSLYGKFPDTFLLHIKGYEFDFLDQLSNRAENNLNIGLEVLKGLFSKSINPVESICKYIDARDEKINIALS